MRAFAPAATSASHAYTRIPISARVSTAGNQSGPPQPVRPIGEYVDQPTKAGSENTSSGLRYKNPDFKTPLTLRRLTNRNLYIRTHIDRQEFGFPEPTSEFTSEILDKGYLPLPFKSRSRRYQRVCYRVCSLDGLVVSLYDKLTNASYTVIFGGIIGIMTTLQTYTAAMLADPNATLSVVNVAMSFGVLVAAILAILFVVYLERLYMRYWRKPAQQYNRQRFDYAYDFYMQNSAYADDRKLEYDSDASLDPDVAIMHLLTEEDHIVDNNENDIKKPKTRNCCRNVQRFFLYNCKTKSEWVKLTGYKP